jgi:alkylation response protein AidB-like acyl-CoA dehydrogenase
MTQLQEQHSKDTLKDPVSVAAEIAQKLAVSSVERDQQAGLPTQEIQLLKAAGLLPLVVPRQYGGTGAAWGEAFKVIQMLAAAEGSIGQLYANQLILSVASQTSGTPEQAERYYRATAKQNLFWGNAFNTRDTRLKITPEGRHYRVNGIKSFGTGVAVADLRVFSAVQAGVDYPIIFILPKEREGIIYNDDWDNMGQRRTASGSFTFQNVLVNADEILGPPPQPESGFATLLFVVNQLAKTHVYLGIAEGAFEAARTYTATQTRPWIMSGVDRATQDPHILRHYGDLWVQLQAAIGLAEKAAQRVQAAWEQEWMLTPQERGEVAIPVYAAKAMATKVGLEITNRMFEMMGARSTAAKYGFDRYWRDLRTFTLHDPVDYKLQSVGDWVLNQELPMVSQYS